MGGRVGVWGGGVCGCVCTGVGVGVSVCVSVGVYGCVGVCVHTLSCIRCVQYFATPWTRPGSSVHGIFPVRIMERVTISYSKGSS